MAPVSPSVQINIVSPGESDSGAIKGESGSDMPRACTIIRLAGSRPTRLVLFRRPIELRSQTRGDLSAMVLTVLVEQVSELLGRPPEEVDPRYDPDTDD